MLEVYYLRIFFTATGTVRSCEHRIGAYCTEESTDLELYYAGLKDDRIIESYEYLGNGVYKISERDGITVVYESLNEEDIIPIRDSLLIATG